MQICNKQTDINICNLNKKFVLIYDLRTKIN